MVYSLMSQVRKNKRWWNDDKKQWWDFLWAMTEKEIKARYKMAIFGFLWLFLNPLLQMVVVGVVFQFFIPVKVDNYFVFLFAGLLPWNFFSTTVIKCTSSIVNERTLIQKARFPREAIVLSIVLSNFLNLFLSMVLFLGVLIILRVDFWPHIILLPIVMLWLLLLTAGLSLLAAALNVKYRDINFIIQAVMPLWFYLTPIIYTINLLPEYLHRFFILNPVSGVMETFRMSILGTNITSKEMILINTGMSLIVAVMGWIVFKKESLFFDDWI